MKKYYLFIALAIIAAMTVSCKSNKKAENKEADAEVVDAAKTILTDDVLATLDEIAKPILESSGSAAPESIIASALTEEEKLIKPDYLLEASQANEMVTKSQKLNALAILFVERPIRIAYGMPTEETDKVIAHLAAEVNDPISFDDEMNLTPAEKTKMAYEFHKEKGDIKDFWQYVFAIQIEINYLISNNPDAFFRNITNEQYEAYASRYRSSRSAVRVLAEYDKELSSILEFHDANRASSSDEESDVLFATKESAKQHMVAYKDIYVARRANLLK